jgi:dinuclear metal center YbgI/SA1388 family protein
MKIKELIRLLERYAPPVYAEDYDNVGLLTGNADAEITGVLCTLDCTEAVVEEALKKKCNLIVAHHPIVFKGLKKITGANYVERTIIKAIKNDMAIYAIHTNLDNVYAGVNQEIARLLGLKNTSILVPKQNQLVKLAVFVPNDHLANVQDALFAAGAGHIGNYSDCSFNTEGKGTFKALEGTDPYVGKQGERHTEPETRVEVVLEKPLLHTAITAMKAAHPYEEVAYDLFPLANAHAGIGSGMVGEFEKPMAEKDFLALVKTTFRCGVVRHTALTGQPVLRVAVCGGSGSFLLKNAIGAGAQAFVTADFKYHEFFDAEEKILVADTGHFENEQFTAGLLARYIEQGIKNIATFAVRLSEVETNPVKYF